MAGPDVLSGGPEGRLPTRRWVVAGIVLALVFGVPALVHTARGRTPAPAPTTALPPATQSIVISVATGSRWAYALVAHCGTGILHDCDYRVHRRELFQPGWRTTAVHATGRTTTGLDVTMRVTPDDHV